MKTNKEKVVLVTKETAASIGAGILTNPLKAALVAALGGGIYLNEVVIPGKDKEIDYGKNRPVKVDTKVEVDTIGSTKIKGKTKTDTIEVKDTVFINPLQIAGSAPFTDTLITGNVTGFADVDTSTKKPRVGDVGLNYSLVKPITERTITKVETIKDTVKVPIPRNFRFQAGAFIGGGPSAFGLGPEIGILTKADNNYSYRYNIIDRTHWVSYKSTIRLRK